MKLMFLLMLTFAVAIGWATFIENNHDTATAKILVYSATWFEMLLFLLCINLLGSMVVQNVFRKGKLSILLFHLSFVLILLGAGISRQYGFEGSMYIQEGESSNIIYSQDPYIQVSYGVIGQDGKMENNAQYMEQKYMSEITDRHNDFELKLPISGHKPLKIEYVDYIKDAVYDVTPGNGKGHEYILLEIPQEGGGATDTAYLKSGTFRMIGGIPMSFNTDEFPESIRFFTNEEGEVEFKAPIDVYRFNPDVMETDTSGLPPMMLMDTLKSDTTHRLKVRNVHYAGQGAFFYKTHYTDAIPKWIGSKKEDEGRDHLMVKVSCGDQTVTKALRYHKSETCTYANLIVDDVMVTIGYGPKTILMPFNVKCIDFRMETYTGSSSPSTYECDVAIDDPENETYFEDNIFMNHVLDYNGYRFFQSDYDWSPKAKQTGSEPDITILSVNHDLPGTIVTYIGYILMALGFIWSLFNKNSRFTMLRRKVKEYKLKKTGITTLLVLVSLGSFATGKDEFIESANGLLVQEFKGRISPFQTHAHDILFKIKKRKTHKPGWSEVEYSAMEVYISMLADPVKWHKERLIYVDEAVRDVFATDGKYISLYDLLDSVAYDTSNIVIREDLVQAQKKSHGIADRDKSKWDKGILKLFDNANLYYWVLIGDRFRIFPTPDTGDGKWISNLQIDIGKYHGADSAQVTELYLNFFVELKKAEVSGEYSEALKALNEIKDWQRKVGVNLPSVSKVNMEIMYNNMNIFFRLLMIYSTLGGALLLFLLLNVFYPLSKVINTIIRVLFWIAVGAAALHAFGLGLRWYIVGHAPWSNGYEALVFIGFSTMLAGIIFYKSSRFTIGASAILASLILGVAHGASTDPELTNLVPVLKSVWLVIHVAIITSSYAFLGLGAVLALINVFLYIFRTRNSNQNYNLTMNELTTTAELTMTIGLIMAAIGTFLGGVWANESWGRYWGWDAKETWALVIVLTYSILLHIRFIPFMKGKLLFNVLSVSFYGTVIMTYFGVNFYLTKGLHSYAQGDSSALPIWAIITIIVLILVFATAFVRNHFYRKSFKS